MSSDDFLLLILSSPSGAGKTRLKDKRLGAGLGLTFSVSHTTRPPRPNETDGKEYHFVDRGAFDAMVANDEFLEWAEVHGNRYGTSKAEIERAQGRGLIFDIDYQGARQIRAKRADVVGVFILPPSMQELEARLRRRATESAMQLQ